MDFIYKTGKTNRKFGSADNIDWCSFTKNTLGVKNYFSKKFMQELTKILPKNFFICPLVGKVEIVNLNIALDLYKMLPKGKFLVRFKLFDKKSAANLYVEC